MLSLSMSMFGLETSRREAHVLRDRNLNFTGSAADHSCGDVINFQCQSVDLKKYSLKCFKGARLDSSLDFKSETCGPEGTNMLRLEHLVWDGYYLRAFHVVLKY